MCDRQKLDLLDSEKVFNYIKKNHFDIVIHGATYDAAPEFSKKDPNAVLENNLRMFFNLARCSDYFVKMIYFGSGAEFGRENWIPQMTEDYFDIFVPIDQYGYSKYLMNQYASNWSYNIYNLRLFGLFGKYDDWRYRFISNACCKAILNMPITMRHNATFDYLYIDDLIKVVKWVIDATPEFTDYNVCSGNSYSYLTLANQIVDISKKDIDIIIENKNPSYEYSGNNSRLLEESGLNFANIKETVADLYGWYSQNQSIIDRRLFVY